MSTSSDTIVIRCSSVSTVTRIDWLAALRVVFLGGFGRRAFGGLGGGRLDRRFTEGAFEIVERILARPQRPFQHLQR